MKNKNLKVILVLALFACNATILYNCTNAITDKKKNERIEYGTYEMIDGDFYVRFTIYKEKKSILCLSEYKNGQETIDTLYMSKHSMHNKSGLKFEYINGYNKEYYFIPDKSDLCYLVNSSNKIFYVSNRIK